VPEENSDYLPGEGREVAAADRQRGLLRSIAVAVSPELRARAQAAAMRERRSLSNWIRAVIERELERMRSGGEAAP
jgi:predicted HicB family RNase H-like nuclease